MAGWKFFMDMLRRSGKTAEDLPAITKVLGGKATQEADPRLSTLLKMMDDTAKIPKKPSAIERALIKERETERMLNTNNPSWQDPDSGQFFTTFLQKGSTASGKPKFQLAQQKLEPEPKTIDSINRLNRDIYEQLQGKRFFFPAKARIDQKQVQHLASDFEPNDLGQLQPKLVPYGGYQDEGMDLFTDVFGTPRNTKKTVFFADGSEI